MATKKSTPAAKKSPTSADPTSVAAAKKPAAPKVARAAKSVATPDAPAAAKRPSAPRKPRPTAAAPSRDERVRLAAYRLFEARGGTSGDELSDWLAAEALITLEDAAVPAARKPRARVAKS